jgi:protein TonB
MLATLLESQHQRSRNIQFQAVSIAVHTALILGAVVATRGVIEAGVTEPPTTIVRLPTYQRPREGPIVPSPRTPWPQIPTIPAIPNLPNIPDVLPEIGTLRNQFPVDPHDCIEACPPLSVRFVPTTGAGVMTADQVDRAAFLRPGTGRPLFPEALRSAALEGEVRVQFVIDTSGRADMATLKILNSSHALFHESVRRALVNARFSPAEFGGRKVRQIVQMPFVFSLKK